MASGKQVLLSVLQALSQRNQDELETASSDNVRAGFLLHGSSAKYMWPLVERLSWQPKMESDFLEGGDSHKLVKKGIGIKPGLLSELFDALWEENQIPDAVKERFPEITQEDFTAGMTAIHLLLTALEWNRSLHEVEQGGQLDEAEKTQLIDACRRKLEEYRLDPEDYS